MDRDTQLGSTKQNRRRFLKAAGSIGVVGVAGCTGGGNGNGGNGNGDDGNGDDGNGDDGNGDDGNGGNGNGGNGNGDDTVEWTIGTSGSDSATHASGVAMSQVISEESDRIDMSAQTTGGTAANPTLVDQGEIDIAQSTSWSVFKANRAEEPYNDGLSETMTQVLPFMSLEYYLVKRDVDELADIETVSDIPQDGSINMAFGQQGGTNFFAGLDGFRMSGIEDPQEKYNIRSLDWGDQGSSMSDGRLDICIVYSVSLVTLAGWEQEMDATTDVSVVEWEFSEEDVIDSGLPYEYIEAPTDVWEQDMEMDATPSVGVGYETIFPESIDEDLGYEFVSTVMENIDAVRDASAVLQGAGPDLVGDLLLASPDAPVHPGAERYYREEDLWSDDFTSLEDYEG
ncbi:TAXI family TRAP transporter solute-binding subunit [Halalkalirubrum salinum]|uniref:TAXI family TRAP transporter solute-binding subunit n=1 Tax=Halalkalirubrum salinum TaxID=2563889 RepID=UPI0010FB042E|nr:TAXI family TRAP transporter solute-binding subunit [Halalkalirubrum salinum]